MPTVSGKKTEKLYSHREKAFLLQQVHQQVMPVKEWLKRAQEALREAQAAEVPEAAAEEEAAQAAEAPEAAAEEEPDQAVVQEAIHKIKTRVQIQIQEIEDILLVM